MRGLWRVRGTTRTTCCDGGLRKDRTLLDLVRGLTAAVQCPGSRVKLFRADILTGCVRRASIVTCARSKDLRRKKQTSKQKSSKINITQQSGKRKYGKKLSGNGCYSSPKILKLKKILMKIIIYIKSTSI